MWKKPTSETEKNFTVLTVTDKDQTTATRDVVIKTLQEQSSHPTSEQHVESSTQATEASYRPEV